MWQKSIQLVHLTGWRMTTGLTGVLVRGWCTIYHNIDQVHQQLSFWFDTKCTSRTMSWHTNIYWSKRVQTVCTWFYIKGAIHQPLKGDFLVFFLTPSVLSQFSFETYMNQYFKEFLYWKLKMWGLKIQAFRSQDGPNDYASELYYRKCRNLCFWYLTHTKD